MKSDIEDIDKIQEMITLLSKMGKSLDYPDLCAASKLIKELYTEILGLKKEIDRVEMELAIHGGNPKHRMWDHTQR